MSRVAHLRMNLEDSDDAADMLDPPAIVECDEEADDFPVIGVIGKKKPNLHLQTSNARGNVRASMQVAKSGTLNTHGYTISSYGITGTPTHPLIDNRTNKFLSSLQTNINVDNSFTSTTQPIIDEGLNIVLGQKIRIQDLVFLDNLGAGQNGTVRKALFLPNYRLVAVKMAGAYDKSCRHQILHELSVFEKIQQEGKDCQSERVVEFVGAFMSENRITMALEYVNLGSLDQFIKKHGVLQEPTIRHVVKQILEGLAYLQSRKEVHRDIKPANVLINHVGEIKISDFGLTKQLQEPREGCNTFVGTISYLAPERVSSDGAYSYPVDVWALGMSIFDMAVGSAPTPMEIWGMIDFMRNPSPELGDEFSDELRDFVHQCLLKDPVERPSAKELLSHPFITNHSDSYHDAWPYDMTRDVNTIEGEAIADGILQSLVSQYQENEQQTIQELRKLPEQWRFIKKEYKKACVTISTQLGSSLDQVQTIFEKRLRHMVSTAPRNWRARQTLAHQDVISLLDSLDLNGSVDNGIKHIQPRNQNINMNLNFSSIRVESPKYDISDRTGSLLSNRRSQINSAHDNDDDRQVTFAEATPKSRRMALGLDFHKHVSEQLQIINTPTGNGRRDDFAAIRSASNDNIKKELDKNIHRVGNDDNNSYIGINIINDDDDNIKKPIMSRSVSDIQLGISPLMVRKGRYGKSTAMHTKLPRAHSIGFSFCRS